jgi:outer membrane receptor for ferrienterochelin and colicins
MRQTHWPALAAGVFVLSAAAGAAAADDPPVPATGERCAIRGTVMDVTGMALPGATLVTEPGGATAITAATGTYCIPSASGRLTLIVVLDGFAEERHVVDVPGGGLPGAVDIRLRPAGVREQVVVTATRTSRRLADVAVRTEVVDGAAMAATGARTLADAMEFTTGVRVETNCQNCNFSQIRLLGLGGPYTQILMDGQPIVSSLAQVYGIEQIPARLIERIEVVKGGGSALYGPGAVGGVVNVIAREPSRRGGLVETRIDVAQGVPSYAGSGAVDWLSADRRTFATGFVQLDEVKPVDVSGDGFTEVAARDLVAFGARVNRYALDGRAKITGEVTRLAEDRRGGDLLRLPPDQATIAEWVRTDRLGASATWFHGMSPRLDYRLTLAVADTARDSYYGTNRDPNAFGDTENRLVVFDSQVNQYAGRHTVSWGLQHSSDDLRDTQPAYGRFTDAVYRSTGLFVQDDWGFAKGWQLVSGVRLDKHSAVDRVIASPRLALMISPVESLDIRASVARGFRAPQVFDEDLHLSSVGGDVRLIRLSPDLREETSTNYMLGAEWKPEAGPGQALLEANLFSTRLEDLFHVQAADDPLTGPREFVKVNAGGARVSGVELNGGWGIGDRFVLQGGMVFQRARFDTPEPDFGSRTFFRTPARYGNVTLTWQGGRFGDWFAGLRYTGSMVAPHYAGYIAETRLERTPSFLTVDASVSRAIGERDGRRLVLTLGGRNLTNAYQRDLDQGPLRDADYIYGPRRPRSVSLTLRVEL